MDEQHTSYRRKPPATVMVAVMGLHPAANDRGMQRTSASGCEVVGKESALPLFTDFNSDDCGINGGHGDAAKRTPSVNPCQI